MAGFSFPKEVKGTVCFNDICVNIELIQPVIDTLTARIEAEEIDKYVFSKLIYATELLEVKSESEKDIKRIIQEAAYLFCQKIDTEAEKKLSSSFASEAIKWFKYKIFQESFLNEENYKESIRSDFNTIKNFFFQRF